MGITSTAPAARVAGLGALEAKTLGESLASEWRFTLVDPARGITGTLSLSPRLPSGRQYAVVADDSSKQLCVVLAHNVSWTGRGCDCPGLPMGGWRSHESRGPALRTGGGERQRRCGLMLR
jgi:hypothetical protein